MHLKTTIGSRFTIPVFFLRIIFLHKKFLLFNRHIMKRFLRKIYGETIMFLRKVFLVSLELNNLCFYFIYSDVGHLFNVLGF